ncbi:hypothetical protein KGM_209881B, partial [Danaus plexippus plexippus]
FARILIPNSNRDGRASGQQCDGGGTLTNIA